MTGAPRSDGRRGILAWGALAAPRWRFRVHTGRSQSSLCKVSVRVSGRCVPCGVNTAVRELGAHPSCECRSRLVSLVQAAGEAFRAPPP